MVTQLNESHDDAQYVPQEEPGFFSQRGSNKKKKKAPGGQVATGQKSAKLRNKAHQCVTRNTGGHKSIRVSGFDKKEGTLRRVG